MQHFSNKDDNRGDGNIITYSLRETFMIKFLIRFFVLVSVAIWLSCSGQGTINVGNPDTSGGVSIKIGQLTSDGKSTITIPEEVFGGASQIEISTFSIQVNGETIQSQMPASNSYNTSSKVVIFTLQGLKNGDTLIFLIFRSGSQLSSYSGLVSTTEETEAALEESITTSVQGIFKVDETEDTCGGGSDRDALCLQVTEEGDFMAFDLDDDNTEVITDLDGNTFTYTLQDTIVNYPGDEFTDGSNLNCTLTYSNDGQKVTGQCQATYEGVTSTCNLSYIKVGDDPFGHGTVEGPPYVYGCDNPDGFTDAR